MFWIAQKKSKSTIGDLAFYVLASPAGAAEKVEKLLPGYARRHDMLLGGLGVETNRYTTIQQEEEVRMSAVKDEAKKLIDSMPDHATWDDVMYEFYVKKKLEQALKEAAEGDVISHEEVKEHLFRKS